MSQPYYIEDIESEAEMCDSDDSQEDPSFNILEDTRSKLSNLSIKRKSKTRVPVELDEDADCIETTVPVFDANDEKSFEIVQKIIEGCQLEKLKVEQCKLYLRKYGLRLTGKKDILINRIKEHISIKNGEGEHKYPVSSFVMNCKGDACTGDVVMFEQNVYELYNIASRSASGPPCGQRVVAGRIVKESYGAAKQQHTFTIEVLWSKGTKPLPPLHPLLIKGRNLYRLKTMRQRWEDESERQKILSEKHVRGNVARTTRDARLQEKKMKKSLRENRTSNGNIKNEQENKGKISCLQEKEMKRASNENIKNEQENKGKVSCFQETKALRESRVSNEKIKKEQENKIKLSSSIQHQRAPLTGMDHKHHGAPYNIENMNPNTVRGIDGILRKSLHVEQKMEFYPSTGMDHNQHGAPYKKDSMNSNTSNGRIDFSFRKSIHVEQNMRFDPKMGHYGASYNRENMSSNSLRLHYDYNPSRRSFQRYDYYYRYNPPRLYQKHDYDYCYDPSRLYQRRDYDYDPHNQQKSYGFQQVTKNNNLHYQGNKQQMCRNYARGGCHYGANCKYLH